MEYVSFSAIGDSDPIRDYYDGPMLHIVRKYRPKKTYLLFTEEMKKRETETECYSRAIKHIAPECGIERIFTNIVNASDFDAFHELYSKFITQINCENPDAKILVNVSSGTPQMKTTMCLEVVSHNVLLQAIQVASHNCKSNRGTRFFDPYIDNLDDELMNLIDSLDDAPCRCSDPGLIGFSKSMIKNQIKSLTASNGVD